MEKLIYLKYLCVWLDNNYIMGISCDNNKEEIHCDLLFIVMVWLTYVV